MRRLLACFLSSCLLLPLHAQTPAAPAGTLPGDEGVRDMETIVVTGVQPGPGLWKVSKGDHVLWVLGTVTPLPKGMRWLSRDVEAVIAESQEVIDPPGVTFDSDVGMVRGMLMIPSLLKARRNPDGETLRELLPAALYARWSVLKAKYLGRDEGVEKWRPLFASQELYQAALRKSGLTPSGVVAPVVAKLAKQYRIERTPVLVKLKIEKPKEAIREFSASPLEDVGCFEKTLSRLESDLPLMAARANAWATGDIEALRSLPYEDQDRACMDAFLQTELARRRGLEDLPQRVEALWLSKADAALASNRTTFATVPASRLLGAGGYLAKLRARGYLIEEPQ